MSQKSPVAATQSAAKGKYVPFTSLEESKENSDELTQKIMV